MLNTKFKYTKFEIVLVILYYPDVQGFNFLHTLNSTTIIYDPITFPPLNKITQTFLSRAVMRLQLKLYCYVKNKPSR